MSAWVLVETLASKQQGRQLYFHALTAIGPKTTAKLEEAHRFPGEADAKRSTAYQHPLCFFEPVAVED
jgi:hypothetical protein